MRLDNTTGRDDVTVEDARSVLDRAGEPQLADDLLDAIAELDIRLTEALERINELEHEKQELLSELVDARAEIL